jgi:cellulose synthase/poly-beta-1,6-N-acetylglucosamine synthase-like glycosyltransferase
VKTDASSVEVDSNSVPPVAPLVIVTPARDEEATIARTIESVQAQTIRPALWVLVDDGSSDATPAILDRAARECEWIRVVKRGDRGRRALGGGVVEAFYDGLAAVDVPYDFLGKLDADIVLPPSYIERALARFEEDSSLGAASGKVYRREGERWIEQFMIDEMVAGQFKLYRREAFERIGGFVREVMWDGIDIHRARMAGYRTKSFHDPELRLVELRPMGASDGSVYRGRLRHGRGQWFMGSTFPYVLASGIFRMRERPYVIGGLLMVVGYLAAAVSGAPRYEDPAFRSELRRWQWARIRRSLRSGEVR